MKEYTLIGEYTLAEGQTKETCEHCGRAIKSVYLVRNNITGKTLKVGMTCIQNIMNLNDTFNKALIRELKKYSKALKEINSFTTAEEEYNNRLELLKVDQEGFIKKYKYGQVWDNELNAHRNITLKDFEENKEYYIKGISYSFEAIQDTLKEQIKKLNNLSKQGLIQIEG